MRIELTSGVRLTLLVLGAMALAWVAKHEGPAARRYLKIETM
jgi:hypothetical protein